MQREECIYNLIPRIIEKAEKPERYVSKHNPKVKPTGSTFGCKGKGRVEGSNLGKSSLIDKPKANKDFGKVNNAASPQRFMKKGTRCVNPVDKTKKPSKFNYTGTRKPSLVKKQEKPVMGLKSSKDFVTANAVETILAVPGSRVRNKQQEVVYRNKSDYGKKPAYLEDVKREVEQENAMIDDFVKENQYLQQDEDEKVDAMDQEEREELVNALKAKWDHVNKMYQKIGHNVVFDTQGKVRRKENLENQLTQIEKDIELLQRGTVMVQRQN